MKKTLNQQGLLPLAVLLGIIVAASAIGAGVYLTRQVLAPLAPLGSQTISLDFLTSDQLTLENIERSPLLKSKKLLPDGSSEYLLTSYLLGRDSKVIAKDGQILFRRLINFTSDNKPLPKFSGYQKKLGDPEEIITGSKYYGYNIHTYIYPNKGYSLVGNPQTDEIFELQRFTPTTLDDYKTKWTEDLNPNNFQNYEVF